MGTILVVDDEDRVRESICDVLEELAGYTTFEASSGDEAIARFMEIRPELVVLDVYMPGGMDGIEVAKEIRKNYRTPILFLSSKGDESDRKRGYEAGAVDYLIKPYDPVDLVAQIRALLELGANLSVDTKSAKLYYGNLWADRARQQVYWHEEKIKLSETQFKIVILLLEQPQESFRWETLKKLIYGHENKELSTVQRHVYDVKGRFKDTGKGDPIEVVHGAVRLVESS